MALPIVLLIIASVFAFFWKVSRTIGEKLGVPTIIVFFTLGPLFWLWIPLYLLKTYRDKNKETP